MIRCSECGEWSWPSNFESVLKQAEGCPGCEPETFRELPSG
jgi:hypothetical protein